MTSKIKHFKELNFTVVAKIHDLYVDYNIYEINGWLEDDLPAYVKDGASSNLDYVEDTEYATVFIEGHVKWDGCSNWMFQECLDNTYIHGCSKSDITRIGLILGECYDWTKELLTSFEGDY